MPVLIHQEGSLICRHPVLCVVVLTHYAWPPRRRMAKVNSPKVTSATVLGSGTVKARLSIAQRGASISTLDKPEAKAEPNW